MRRAGQLLSPSETGESAPAGREGAGWWTRYGPAPARGPPLGRPRAVRPRPAPPARKEPAVSSASVGRPGRVRGPVRYRGRRGPGRCWFRCRLRGRWPNRLSAPAPAARPAPPPLLPALLPRGGLAAQRHPRSLWVSSRDPGAGFSLVSERGRGRPAGVCASARAPSSGRGALRGPGPHVWPPRLSLEGSVPDHGAFQPGNLGPAPGHLPGQPRRLHGMWQVPRVRIWVVTC